MYDVAIIGAGPAGLFAAYELIENNSKLKVALLDKGHLAKNRKCPLQVHATSCVNCKPCAILSGYGGAGTFSDGKLNTGISSPYCKKVLEDFVKSIFGETFNFNIFLTKFKI